MSVRGRRSGRRLYGCFAGRTDTSGYHQQNNGKNNLMIGLLEVVYCKRRVQTLWYSKEKKVILGLFAVPLSVISLWYWAQNKTLHCTGDARYWQEGLLFHQVRAVDPAKWLQHTSNRVISWSLYNTGLHNKTNILKLLKDTQNTEYHWLCFHICVKVLIRV